MQMMWVTIKLGIENSPRNHRRRHTYYLLFLFSGLRAKFKSKEKIIGSILSTKIPFSKRRFSEYIWFVYMYINLL